MKTIVNQQKIIYTDLTRTFSVNPISGDVNVSLNHIAVKESIINLLFTSSNERPYSLLGAGIEKTLFELATIEQKFLIQQSIEETIKTYEPRARLLKTDVRFDEDNNAVDIEIVFTLLNNPQPFGFTLSLQRIR